MTTEEKPKGMTLGKRTVWEGKTTHGLSRTPEYRAWMNMRLRCYNPGTIGYEKIGGRGIEVCDTWKWDFPKFLEDMGQRPDQTQLTRRDTALNFTKDNSFWGPASKRNAHKYKVSNPIPEASFEASPLEWKDLCHAWNPRLIEAKIVFQGEASSTSS